MQLQFLWVLMPSAHFQAGAPLPKRQSKSTCTSLAEQNGQSTSKHDLGIALQQELGAQPQWPAWIPEHSDMVHAMHPCYMKALLKSSSKSWKLWSRRPRQSQEFTVNHLVHLRAFQSQCRAEYFRRDDRQGPPNNQAWTRAPDKCMCEANMLRCCFRSRGNGRKLAWQGTWHEGTVQLYNFFVNVDERIWSWGVLVRWTFKPTYWGDMLEETRMRTEESQNSHSHSQHAD